MSKKGLKVKMKKKDLEPFKQLQSVSYEVGGIMDLNGRGLQRAAFVPGQHLAVKASQIPNYSIQYHTHPNIPALPSDKDTIEYVLSEFKKGKTGKKFPIDALVQTVSDSDLSTFSTSLLLKKAQVMIIFAPEGIYTLSVDQEKLKDFKDGMKTKSQTKRVLNNVSEKYLEKRNEIIGQEEKKLLSALKKEKLLLKFQKTIGKEISKLIDEDHIMIDADYFTWDDKEVSFPIDKKGINFKAKSVFIKLMPK